MAIPSPRQPKPGTDKYYRGGYITQVMTAMDAKHQLFIIIVTMVQSLAIIGADLCPNDKSSNRDYNHLQPLS